MKFNSRQLQTQPALALAEQHQHTSCQMIRMFLQSLADGDNIRQLVSIGGSQTELEGRT
jgi:hypothetical protein